MAHSELGELQDYRSQTGSSAAIVWLRPSPECLRRDAQSGPLHSCRAAGPDGSDSGVAGVAEAEGGRRGVGRQTDGCRLKLGEKPPNRARWWRRMLVPPSRPSASRTRDCGTLPSPRATCASSTAQARKRREPIVRLPLLQHVPGQLGGTLGRQVQSPVAELGVGVGGDVVESLLRLLLELRGELVLPDPPGAGQVDPIGA